MLDPGDEAKQLGFGPAACDTRSLATSGRPIVRVPVLSKTAVRTPPSCSSAVPWRNTMPRRAAWLIPPMMATGVARMRGQGVATTSTASTRTGSPDPQPRQGADHQRERGEPHGVAVGQPLNRRLAGLGRADQLHDPGVLALPRERGRAKRERALEVEAAAPEGHARRGRDRHRLAGQPGDVHVRTPAEHDSVARHHLAGPDQELVADGHGIGRDRPRPRRGGPDGRSGAPPLRAPAPPPTRGPRRSARAPRRRSA